MGSLNRHIIRLSGLMVILAGCGPQGPPNDALGTPPPPPVREGDGLLTNPSLQELVDLQVQRAGADLQAYLSAPEPEIRARAAFALASVQ